MDHHVSRPGFVSRRGAARLFLGAVAAASYGGTSHAADAALPMPTGKVILTISGKIKAANDARDASFDLPMLEAMPQHSFATKTRWYADAQTFEGVLMAELMQKVGCYGTSMLAVALNDYSSEIPIEDFARFGVIMALKHNGQYMPVREKGPLFIIYPFDSDPELRSQKYSSRCAWQLRRLVVS